MDVEKMYPFNKFEQIERDSDYSFGENWFGS